MMQFSALVVEDEAALRIIYDRLLKNAGYEVWLARDGGQAIDILENHTPQLIFLDMLLPMVNGVQVLQYLAQDDRFNKTHVVIASSSADFARHVNLVTSSEFILKPIMPSQIMNIAGRIKAL